MANEVKKQVFDAPAKYVKELPSIQSLYNDVEATAQNNDLNILLNQEPKKEWIKPNPFAGNSEYIPIAIIEYLLTSIFVKHRVEIKESKHVLNSFVVTVRLHYMNPISGEWEWQDGIGAAPLQTDSGTTISAETLKTSALSMAAPMAETFAVKDAADKLGKLFGKDLNRKHTIDVQSRLLDKKETLTGREVPTDTERLYKSMRSCKNEQQLETFKRHCRSREDNNVYEEVLQSLKK